MKWIAGLLGTTLATAGLAWALVTTGKWPLDDRKQPAMAIYTLNSALGQWLVDHGEPIPAEGTADRREAAAPEPFHERGSPGIPAPAPAPQGLTAAELAAVQETLRTDPRFRGRVFVRTGITPGRG